MKVKNLNITSEKVCSKCGSWITHWKNKTGQTATSCSATDCANTRDILGAHVKKVGGTDHAHYIVPLCPECNHRTGEFEVSRKLVTANPCS